MGFFFIVALQSPPYPVKLPVNVEESSEDIVDVLADDDGLVRHPQIVAPPSGCHKMAAMAVAPVDKPLPLGEVLAETTRVYRARLWPALGLGAVAALGFVVAGRLPDGFAIVVLALLFTAGYAFGSRLAAGDAFGQAWAQVGRRAAVLLVLTLVVSVPFSLGVFIRAADPLAGLVFILFAVSWLVFLGFSIPISVCQPEEERAGLVHELAEALRRSIGLARTEFLHAVGVVAALLVIYGILGPFLAAALVGFAENSVEAAFTLSQLMLAPFFFLGLAVLYFEQCARARLAALDSGRDPGDSPDAKRSVAP